MAARSSAPRARPSRNAMAIGTLPRSFASHAHRRRFLRLTVGEPRRREGRSAQGLFDIASENGNQGSVAGIGGCQEQVSEPLPLLLPLILFRESQDHVPRVGKRFERSAIGEPDWFSQAGVPHGDNVQKTPLPW